MVNEMEDSQVIVFGPAAIDKVAFPSASSPNDQATDRHVHEAFAGGQEAGTDVRAGWPVPLSRMPDHRRALAVLPHLLVHVLISLRDRRMRQQRRQFW